MDDVELLGLAAKAAGYQVEWVGNSGCYYRCEEDIGREQWDPLEDDGDALRLAVKLMLSVTIGPCQVQAVSISGALRGEFPKEDAIYQDMGIANRERILALAKCKLSTKAIAERTGLSTTTVRTVIREAA